MSRIPAAVRAGRLDAWLVLLVVAAASLGRFGNGYVMDDRRMIVEESAIHDVSNVPGFFVRSAMEAATDGEQSRGLSTYRPLALATMTVSSTLSGREPWGYHLSALLLHLAVVASVYGMLRRLPVARYGGSEGTRRVGSAALALWLGLHPELCEAHVWINGRSDVLAALGLAWAAAAAHASAAGEGVSAQRRSALAAAAFLLACLGKETALLALPAIALGAYAGAPAGSGRVRTAVRVGAWLAAAAAVFVALRALATATDADQALATGGHLLRALRNLGWYWVEASGHVLAARATGMRVIGDEYAGLPAAVFVSGWLIAALACAWVLREVSRRPEVSAGVIGYAAVLGPVALISAGNWPGWGRYLYAPTVLLVLGAGPWAIGGVGRWCGSTRARRWALGVAGVAMAVWFVAGTVRAVGDYRDFGRFYAAAARDWPGSSLGPAGLGERLHAEGRYAEATPYLETAVALAPTTAAHLRNLALNLVFEGRARDAYALASHGLATGVERASFENVAGMAAAAFDPQRAARHWIACIETPQCRANLERSMERHPAAVEFQRVVLGTPAAPGSALEALQRGLAGGGGGRR